MTRFCRKTRWVSVAITAALCVVVGAVAYAPASPRPARTQDAAQKGAQQAAANVDDVSDIDQQTPAFDRVLLRDGTLYECEPLQPRPLGDLGNSDTVEFRPLDAGTKPVKVGWNKVSQVVYFEDLLLKKANLLLQQHQFDDAFELLELVQRRAADWPGVEQTLQRLLFEEASSLSEGGHPLRAVNLLTDLRGRNPDYPDLAAAYDRGAERLLADAMATQNYRQVRWLLHRFESQFPGRPVVQRWREQLADTARNRMEAALASENADNLPEAARLIDEAARIWPELPELQQHVMRILSKHARVTVAVQQLPEQFGGQDAGTPAEARVARLLYQSLIAPSAAPEPESYRAQLARAYETSNFGRRVTFELPPNLNWSDGARVSAMDAAYALNRRSDPRDPAYQSQWAQYAPQVRVDGPFRLSVDFAVPPLRAEALFQFPVLPQHVMTGRRRSIGQSPAAREDQFPPGSGPFTIAARSATQVDYRANPRYGGTAPGIQQLVEERFADAEEALRALVRGQVALVEHVPPFELEKVRSISQVAVAAYAVPRVHMIVFDFRTPALRVRSLRRAMAYAIDRAAILSDDLLAGAATDADKISPGPLRRESYYAHASLEPRPYEPLLAAALVANAKTQLAGVIPPLKLHYPPDDVARRACRRIQKYLKAAGIEVQLVERTDSGIRQALAQGQSLDLVYRITTTIEPAVEAPQMVSLAPVSAAGGSWVSSDWMRQLLVQLQQASNVPAARTILQEIDRVAHDDVAVLPLWQITDYFVYDRRLRGIQASPLDLYENVDQWRWEPTIVQDSFAKEP